MGGGRSRRTFGCFSLGRICLPESSADKKILGKEQILTSHGFGCVEDQSVGSISHNRP